MLPLPALSLPALALPLPRSPALPASHEVAQLLVQMRAVLSNQGGYSGYEWAARALGCDLYGHGATPEEAMRDALQLRAGIRAKVELPSLP